MFPRVLWFTGSHLLQLHKMDRFLATRFATERLPERVMSLRPWCLGHSCHSWLKVSCFACRRKLKDGVFLKHWLNTSLMTAPGCWLTQIKNGLKEFVIVHSTSDLIKIVEYILNRFCLFCGKIILMYYPCKQSYISKESTQCYI